MICGEPLRIAIIDKAAPCPLDQFNRRVHASVPNGSGIRCASDYDRVLGHKADFFSSWRPYGGFNHEQKFTLAEPKDRVWVEAV